MTLNDLLLKYEFDTVVPNLLTVDEPIKDNLYAFKEAFDTLRRMAPALTSGFGAAKAAVAIVLGIIVAMELPQRIFSGRKPRVERPVH